jgi:hypothetical protein
MPDMQSSLKEHESGAPAASTFFCSIFRKWEHSVFDSVNAAAKIENA